MKKYNINTYKIYKEDVKQAITLIPDVDYEQLTRNQLITKFMPLVENISKKFSTASQASGTLDILDIIQEGSVGLVKAVDRIDWKIFNLSEDKDKTMKSFLSKRIRGSIRRSIDMYRGDMRIPEHKLNDIRKNFGKDEKMVAMFFNSIFLSTDDTIGDGDSAYEVEDKSEPYNMDLLNTYLLSLLRRYLNSKEYQVLRLSYGLDCEKQSAQTIANKLGLKGSSAFVRVSQLKRQAVDKLINNVKPEQVLDYM